MKKNSKLAKSAADDKKRSYLSQGNVPSMTLDEALRVPRAILENYAGAATSPLKVGKALNVEPGGSKLKMLSGASLAYGLITGGAQASEVAITDLARRILKPKIEGDDVLARREAFLAPRVVGEFLRKYDGEQIPRSDIAHNVLEEMGVPPDKVDQTLTLINNGAQALGLTQEIKGKTYVDLTGVPVAAFQVAHTDNGADIAPSEVSITPPAGSDAVSVEQEQKVRGEKISVFISHGKNFQIMQQIKEILTFGKFDAVVSVEKESTAIPVPDKVFADMRRCSAGVIHVAKEDELLDQQGNKVSRINENVLIEIGAAIALYNKNFVLLVEKGITLPSNLQGLYRCEYEGNKLDYDATIKLLRTFNEFKF